MSAFHKNAQLLEQTNGELRQTNQDIQNFAYTYSYDLKYSLRGYGETSISSQSEVKRGARFTYDWLNAGSTMSIYHSVKL